VGFAKKYGSNQISCQIISNTVIAFSLLESQCPSEFMLLVVVLQNLVIISIIHLY